ncbi:hypothetical protein MMC14_003044 [Varicellaria rhodocarpa]|nr:hypothetical protein [Varicellaria rhodocarpa]
MATTNGGKGLYFSHQSMNADLYPTGVRQALGGPPNNSPKPSARTDDDEAESDSVHEADIPRYNYVVGNTNNAS